VTGFEHYRRYQTPATGNVMRPGLNYLTDLIVRPGIEKKLWPLVMYRGNVTPRHAHRLWNFALLMMAAEAETLSDGLKIAHNPAFSQLCGPLKKPTKLTLRSFFGRLWDTPFVTDNIPGLSEYVRLLGLGPSGLTPVDIETARAQCAPWRTSTHPEAGREKGERGAPIACYPYVVHDHTKPEGHDLVDLVNKAVPRGLPENIRADVCQDLIVALLAGDLTKEQIGDRDRIRR
jgi:hypothetical protein